MIPYREKDFVSLHEFMLVRFSNLLDVDVLIKPFRILCRLLRFLLCETMFSQTGLLSPEALVASL